MGVVLAVTGGVIGAAALGAKMKGKWLFVGIGAGIGAFIGLVIGTLLGLP